MFIKPKVLISCENFDSYISLAEQLNLNTIDTIHSPADCMSTEIAIVKHEPDIVLLETDRIEHEGLQRLLKNIALLKKKPYILSLSSYENPSTDRELLSLGVARCIAAPYVMSDIYTYIMDYIRQIPVDKDLIHAEINRSINDMLTLFHLHSGIQGYGYLRKAIFISALNKKPRLNFSKTVYPEIAKCFDTSPACVEWAIRSAINKAWIHSDQSIKDYFFENTKLKNHTKPTNNEFIVTLGCIIYNEYADIIEKLLKQTDNEHCSSPS